MPDTNDSENINTAKPLAPPPPAQDAAPATPAPVQPGLPPGTPDPRTAPPISANSVLAGGSAPMTAQTARPPAQSFWQGMKEGAQGTPKTTDAEGNLITAGPAVRPSAKGVLGNLLASLALGALAGISAGPGESGGDVARNIINRRDENIDNTARKNFATAQQTKKNMDEATQRKAEMAGEQARTAQTLQDTANAQMRAPVDFAIRHADLQKSENELNAYNTAHGLKSVTIHPALNEDGVPLAGSVPHQLMTEYKDLMDQGFKYDGTVRTRPGPGGSLIVTLIDPGQVNKTPITIKTRVIGDDGKWKDETRTIPAGTTNGVRQGYDANAAYWTHTHNESIAAGTEAQAKAHADFLSRAELEPNTVFNDKNRSASVAALKVRQRDPNTSPADQARITAALATASMVVPKPSAAHAGRDPQLTYQFHALDLDRKDAEADLRNALHPAFGLPNADVVAKAQARRDAATKAYSDHVDAMKAKGIQPPAHLNIGKMPQVGDIRKLKTGETVRITKLNPNGTFEHEPVE